MPATVPLSSPVTTIAGARALAESIAESVTETAATAGRTPAEPVGPAIDRVVLFLGSLAHPALVRDAVAVDDVLELLAAARADWAAGWLARHADGDAEASYWTALRERSQLALAA